MKSEIKLQANPDNLLEVSVIRPILIVLLVVYHAFIIYRGGWTQPIGYQDNTVYWWIASSAYSFMLEMFVFISGYVWAFQVFERKKAQTIGKLINTKFKRLIIPSIVFSVLYVVLLGTKEPMSLSLVYEVVCGYGHMWFLPMLFWCFIFVYVIDRIKIKDECKLVLLLLCSLVSFLPLPLRLSSAMYYAFFFYVGFYVRKKLAGKIVNINASRIILLWIVFALSFIALTMVQQKIATIDSTNLFVKASIFSGSRLCQIIYAGLGIAAMYATAVYVANRYKIKGWIIRLGAYCFGVYLFQQFILMGLYYHTQLSEIVGSDWLPWIGTILALGGSLVFSWLFRKTKLGVALI